MRFQIVQQFAGPVAAVEDALTDPDFLAALGALPKLGSPQLVERAVVGEEVHVKVRYAFVGDLSAAVRKVVDPAQLTWIEEQVVDRRTHTTRFTILPDHYARLLRAGGTFTLTTDGAGSKRVADGDIVVGVPLVGGKVERAIVSGLEEYAEAEEDLVRDWLSP